MKLNVVINGDFYDHRITGVQRYAFEIIRELDLLLSSKKGINIEVVLPLDYKQIPDFNHIKVVRFGRYRRIFWQQISLMRYCRRKKAICVCLCTAVPYLYAKNSVQVIHDAATLVHPEFYSKIYLIHSKFFTWNAAKRTRQIITVSEFSKEEINKYCIHNKKNIEVISNAADHVKRISEDDSILDKLGLTSGQYCYSLSSLSLNKNFKWIIEVAKRNPNEKFVISGMTLKYITCEGFSNIPSNVTFTGYVSDKEMISLLKNCKIFLFPTLYEGFGMTPLEALTLGCKIVVSDTPCMHEVYENACVYINPYKYDYVIDDLVRQADGISNDIAEKYSWKKSAVKLLELLERYA